MLKLDTLNIGASEPVFNLTYPGDGYIYAGLGAYYMYNYGDVVSKVKKIRENDFSVVATLTLDAGEYSIFNQPGVYFNGYLYYATEQSPSKVIKVSPGSGNNPPTKVATITLNTGENKMRASVIDTVNGKLILGGAVSYQGDPENAVIVVIDLATFTRDYAITLDYAGNFETAFPMVIDNTNHRLYVGRIKVIRYDTITHPMQRMSGAVTLVSPSAYGASIDVARGYSFWSTEAGFINCIRLSDFSSSYIGVAGLSDPVPHLSLASGWTYIGSWAPAGGVKRIRTDPLSYEESLAFPGEGRCNSAVADELRQFTYWGMGDQGREV